MDLKRKSLNGLIWSFSDSFGVYFVKFGFTIAIARELAPRDYGLTGMIAIFIAIATLISESGFAMALIQKKDADNKDFSTVFFFNLLAAILLYFILFLSAGLIADFYNEPQIKLITRVSSLGIVLSALITVQATLLAKSINFKRQAIINAIAALTSGITGVILAYRGFGVWSLVFMTLSGSGVASLLYWILSDWKPQFIFSINSFKQMYKYGVNIFFQGFTGLLLENIYYPLIGKLYNATELGFFTNADRFFQIFTRRITIAYGRVAFSAFSLLQDEQEKFFKTYKKTFLGLGFVLIPFTGFLIVSAKPLILFLLTNKWEQSISYLQLLYFEGFFFPFLLLNMNILNALGKSRKSLYIDLIKKGMLIIGIVLTFKIGIKALIISQVSCTFLALIYSFIFIYKETSITEIFKGITPIVILTLIFSFLAFSVQGLPINWFLILLLQCSIFVPYIFISKILNLFAYRYFVNLIDPIIPKPLKKLFF